jgi:hypothetical protein
VVIPLVFARRIGKLPRDPCSRQADVKLAPNIAKPRHCIAAKSIIGYKWWEVKHGCRILFSGC